MRSKSRPLAKGERSSLWVPEEELVLRLLEEGKGEPVPTAPCVGEASVGGNGTGTFQERSRKGLVGEASVGAIGGRYGRWRRGGRKRGVRL